MALGFLDKRYCGDFECVLSIDSDAAAVETYRLNFSGEHLEIDIEEYLRNKDAPQADVVIGGPPCQGFSLLNKRRNGDIRRTLWEPYLDIVESANASIFVMENVAELLRSPEIIKISRRAERMGFSLSSGVLNAADYGTPQIRKRAVIIGARRNMF